MTSNSFLNSENDRARIWSPFTAAGNVRKDSGIRAIASALGNIPKDGRLCELLGAGLPALIGHGLQSSDESKWLAT